MTFQTRVAPAIVILLFTRLHHLHNASGLSPPLTSQVIRTTENHVLPESLPIGTALIDYTTANEFIEEHYRIPDYFGEDERRVEPVYDIRKGVFSYLKTKNDSGDDDDTSSSSSSIQLEPAKLDDCGFQVFTAPTKVQDFEDLQDVQANYIQELQDLIPKALGVTQDEVESLVLWHPTLRGEELSVGSRLDDRPGLGPIASRAHIDTDVGAFGLEGVCNLVDKNRVDALPPQNGDNDNDDDCTAATTKKDVRIKDDLMKACDDRRRMLLLNIWRPLVPVSSAPLGVLAAKYDASSPQDAVFPNLAPCRKMSQWYIVSNMQPDECLIFKQYDRRLDKMSDMWHCALNVQMKSDTIMEYSSPKLPRKSFDIKAMVVLKEKVPAELDRLAKALRPRLTQEESGEFCNEQAQRLKSQKQ